MDLPSSVRSEMLVDASEKLYIVLMSKLVYLRPFMRVGTNVVNNLVKDHRKQSLRENVCGFQK